MCRHTRLVADTLLPFPLVLDFHHFQPRIACACVWCFPEDWAIIGRLGRRLSRVQSTNIRRMTGVMQLTSRGASLHVCLLPLEW